MSANGACQIEQAPRAPEFRVRMRALAEPPYQAGRPEFRVRGEASRQKWLARLAPEFRVRPNESGLAPYHVDRNFVYALAKSPRCRRRTGILCTPVRTRASVLCDSGDRNILYAGMGGALWGGADEAGISCAAPRYEHLAASVTGFTSNITDSTGISCTQSSGALGVHRIPVILTKAHP